MAKPSLADMAPSASDELEGSDDSGDMEAPDPLVQAASLIREASADGDDEGLADALKSFITLCGSSEGSKGKKPSLSFGSKE